MKHYLVLAFESKDSQSPSKKMVLHGDITFQEYITALAGKYAYLVVELLTDPE